MRLPSWKQILSTDFQKQFKQLVDQLSLCINNGVQVIYTALNNNLTIRDNFLATVTDVLVTVDSTGKPTQPTAFKLNTTTKIDTVLVGGVTNQTNSSSYPPGAVMIFGSQASNIYTIANVTGLSAGQQYSLRVIAFQQN